LEKRRPAQGLYVVMPVKHETIASLIEPLPFAVAIININAQGKVFLGPGNSAFLKIWRLGDNYLDEQPTFVSFLECLRDNRLLPEKTNFPEFRAHIIGLAVSDTVSIEEWHLPDGSTFTLKFAPLDAERHLFIVEDLSPRLTTERAFNEFVKIHQMTLDHLQEGIAVFESNGFLRLYNPAFALIWKISEDSLTNNLHMTDFLDATRKILPVIKNWPERRAKLSGRLLGRRSGIKKIECNDGVILESSHIPLPNGGVLLRYVDISDRFKLEHTLKSRALEMAEHSELLAGANRLKSEFLSNLSHEIRTPLTSIRGFAELLAENYFGKLNKRQQEYVDSICSLSDDLSGLVENIIDLSAFEAGLLECNIENFDLHNKLVEILSLVKERVRRKKLKLEFDCPINIGCIDADEKHFKQCILHLLGNAITYSSSGGIILISVQRSLGGINIDIKDTGIGIPADDLERVFKRFERGKLTDAVKKQGVGLGLTVVQALFELQGGEVKIKSKINQGTTVSLFLPLTKC